MRKTQGKREKEHRREAKWEARGVSEAEWRKLPDAVKAFVWALLQATGRKRIPVDDPDAGPLSKAISERHDGIKVQTLLHILKLAITTIQNRE
jgi:hypothetical protein